MLPPYVQEEAFVRLQFTAKKTLKRLKDDYLANITEEVTTEQVEFIANSLLQGLNYPPKPSKVDLDLEDFPVISEANLPEIDWEGVRLMEETVKKLKEISEF